MAGFNFLGFEIRKKPEETQQNQEPKSFIAPQNQDGAFTIDQGGVVSFAFDRDIEAQLKTESDYIRKYRDVARMPEADAAITDICDEAIVFDDLNPPVTVVTDNLKQPDSVKKKIQAEFEEILKLLDFNSKGYDLFKKWYIDGRLYYHVLIDPKNLNEGITKLVPISPFNIKKVREIERRNFGTPQGTIQLVDNEKEFYFYTDDTLRIFGKGLKLAKDSICFVHSGQIDDVKNIVEGYLHKALKPANQLRMIEDAIVIYRLARAPERRAFYVDVQNLNKSKAEEYIKALMTKFKNRMTYDVSTGALKDQNQVLSMMEDYWLPRRNGNNVTQIEQLQGGQNLGDIEDVMYFLKKFYKALNVPVSRIDESGSIFNLGKASEITRDELKFSKFVSRIRMRFAELFYILLRIQLIIKKVITEDEWDDIKYGIDFKFLDDSYFEELKNSEILKDRITNLSGINEWIGTHYSTDWVRKNVLMMTEDEIEEMQDQIDKEIKEGTLDPDAGTKPGAIPGQPQQPDEEDQGPPPDEEEPDDGSIGNAVPWNGPPQGK